jgi:type I restriction enzyme S subunit
VPTSYLRKYEILLPPLPIQQKIADALDKASALIEMRKAQIEKLDLLIKSQFIEMFGSIHNSREYPYAPLKDKSVVVSGGTPDRDVEKFWRDGTIPWVKTGELQNCEITDVQEYITLDGLNSSAAKVIPPDTILVAMYGQGKTRGMTAYLRIEGCTNQACACILPSEKINQRYLWHYFILSYDKLREMAKGGNQPNLNLAIIKNFEVLTPPISLQNKFSAFVQKVDNQKTILQQSISRLELNYKSLVQKSFSEEMY